jgi:hypothetical protein
MAAVAAGGKRLHRRDDAQSFSTRRQHHDLCAAIRSRGCEVGCAGAPEPAFVGVLNQIGSIVAVAYRMTAASEWAALGGAP